MKYNFDTVVNRKNTDSLKYDFAAERKMSGNLIPLWIADMDFPAPPEVLVDVEKAVRHGIFGYTEAKNDYYNAVTDWFFSRYGYSVSRHETVKTPGVVYAIAMAIRAFTQPSDGIIIQTPVYYPFFEVIRDNGRNLVMNPLNYNEGNYSIDFDDFESKIKTENVKLFILCNPHNPVGRVWTRVELERLNKICADNNVLVISDEIHCDFVWSGYEHVCFGNIEKNAVIMTAPSKTFNLAGLQIANIFIKNTKLRRLFKSEIAKSGYSQLNTLGLAACKSAYSKGSEWLTELKIYLQGNISAVKEFLKERLPRVKLIEPQGTYLVWLDFSAYKLTQEELDRRIIHEAGLWLDSGTMFGEDGKGFQRINVACPRGLINTALEKLEHAFKEKTNP
ncbi:MAG: pyridoxal phosphate-dependent aminotransferase [Oscillospiraceae bacterium]|nr:pyridoxal phosphate-dependent aminotransferase [Oscillospiraceae bacterium]